jgi:DNA-directed RNA polymerase subunit RPC12/RpoP
MKCFTCGTRMENYDDIRNDFVKVDFRRCPKCGSKAEIQYYDDECTFLSEVKWRR